MPIDPVVLLAEEILQLEKQIHAECRREGAAYDRARMEDLNLLVGRLRARYGELLETVPSSAMGAAQLLRIAADRLPFSQGRYAGHLHRIAERLDCGQRLPADLIWLRALAEAMNDKTGTLLSLAVKGMAHPVVVWRAATAPHPPPPDLGMLSLGPGGSALPFVPQSF